MRPNATSTRKLSRNGVPPATKRVAIYTRQSVDRGDEYGSTDAQREAVAAYVSSQRGVGWVAVEARYDDLGFSGSTVERPAFQRLLHDVDAGGVDVIAVYKIDRLSRSLLDFTQLMRRFEQKGVEFVSVTQQFNTSTSVGRMTLNLLATFAQFERETISERTRDKIAATRRRGLWTGGRPVLGYDAVNGKLAVNADEAARVRAIFQLYLERGSLPTVVEELRARAWANKTWTNKHQNLVPGRAFDKLGVRRLLTNPLYVGRMTLGDEVHDGQHEAIVDAKTWDAVQALLTPHGQERPRAERNKWGVLLRGLLRCATCGSAMTHHVAHGRRRRYSSYVCAKYAKEGAAACPGSRVAVGEIEKYVVEQVQTVGCDPKLVVATIDAAKARLAARRPEIAASLDQIDQDRQRAERERKDLVAATRKGGEGSHALGARLGEVDEAIAGIDARQLDLEGERAALENAVIDGADLRGAISAFAPVWAELTPRERARALNLLIDRITFNGTTSEVAITFRANGFRSLGAANNGGNE